MIKKIEISLVKDFTDLPGPRYINQGKKSGEEFFETVIFPNYIKAKEQKQKLFIDLDGAYGYPPSFIDESFGRLVQYTKEKPEQILLNLSIKCNTAPYLEKDIEDSLGKWYEKYKNNF